MVVARIEDEGAMWSLAGAKALKGTTRAFFKFQIMAALP
jgi:hypothetical protein